MLVRLRKNLTEPELAAVHGLARQLGLRPRFLDGTSDLPSAKRLCGVLNTIESSVPVMLAITEGGVKDPNLAFCHN